jgi:catechol 2,3-dioxygenase-like lactoylglutathione lyase family enzyme
MQRIAQVSMLVWDYDEALAFYIDKLGFELVEDTALNNQGKRWVVIKPHGSNGMNLLLAKASGDAQSKQIGDQTGGRVFLFLETDYLDRDYQNYTKLGVKFIRKPQEHDYGKVAVFEDLYGNLWDLIQHHK